TGSIRIAACCHTRGRPCRGQGRKGCRGHGSPASGVARRTRETRSGEQEKRRLHPEGPLTAHRLAFSLRPVLSFTASNLSTIIVLSTLPLDGEAISSACTSSGTPE